MTTMEEIRLGSLSTDRFRAVLGDEALISMMDLAEATVRRLSARILWNINSTSCGGGVAEMLRSLLPYARGLGIETRWLVVAGDSHFFKITKRIYHAIYGAAGDGSALGMAEREVYERTLAANFRQIVARVRPGDIVLLHDPQCAGLAPALLRYGVTVVWRCHIGTGIQNENTSLGWSFIAPYLRDVSATIFIRKAYVPPQLDGNRAVIIAPSIDVFSPKNQHLDDSTVRSILIRTGIIEGKPVREPPLFRRDNGLLGCVKRTASVVRNGPAPSWERPLVVQVSRWDPLKDPVGVIHAFAKMLDNRDQVDADLVLAGPDVNSVTDDPEGQGVLESSINAWKRLSPRQRSRIHLVSLPADDREENAAIVNALQRHAAVIVQKSLSEGFGLTVTEAMWKGRPIVASAVGGIQDQIQNGVHGILIPDPTDLSACGAAIQSLLVDSHLAERLGARAQERVRVEFLSVRHLKQYADLLQCVDESQA